MPIAARLFFGAIGRTEAAYFKMINEQGGVNGRKIKFISYDEPTPTKTVEHARKLVEGDEVFLLFNVVGTPGNSAIQKYVNQKKSRMCSFRAVIPDGMIPKLSLEHGVWPSFRSEPGSMRSNSEASRG